jgi:hypothetical protein
MNSMKSGRGMNAAESSSNDGVQKMSLGKGQTMSIPYGKDHSSMTGSAKHERISDIGGSIDNLSHSIQGAKANQKP